jgi:hypothetical protein
MPSSSGWLARISLRNPLRSSPLISEMPVVEIPINVGLVRPAIFTSACSKLSRPPKTVATSLIAVVCIGIASRKWRTNNTSPKEVQPWRTVKQRHRVIHSQEGQRRANGRTHLERIHSAIFLADRHSRHMPVLCYMNGELVLSDKQLPWSRLANLLPNGIGKRLVDLADSATMPSYPA